MASITKAVGYPNAGLYDVLRDIQVDLADLKAKYDAHVHGGITAGAANSAVPGTLTAAQKTTLARD